MRDRTPAPLRGSRHDSLCDDDEDEKDVDPFARQICPHELWLALDLDGDFVGHGEGKGGSSAAWKGLYNRFTLRVSWPASVSSPKLPSDSFFHFQNERHFVVPFSILYIHHP